MRVQTVSKNVERGKEGTRMSTATLRRNDAYKLLRRPFVVPFTLSLSVPPEQR